MKRSKGTKAKRDRRHRRVRNKVFGTGDSPRLCVFRSNRNTYCQLIDDEAQKTVACASTLEKETREKMTKRATTEAAREIGKHIAQKAKALGIEKVRFDRAGYKYHGRIKEIAEGAREGGLKL